MDSHSSFMLGGASVAIIVLIAWLTSNLMRAERTIMEVDKKTNEVKERSLVECATYPYCNSYMGLGYGYPLYLMRARTFPYYVTV